MCGICAVVKRNTGIDAACLSAMTDSIAHRGPDADGGMLFGRNGQPAAQAGVVGLGHRRLAIIDLSPRGKQPMVSPSGRSWITFNGEIYNYQEIKRELSAAGVIFNTETDTEVILAGYEVWGKSVITRLNGMFALAIWDSATRTLLVARDRVGIKPLYYTQNPDGFVCGSELKPLLQSGLISRELNTSALNIYLQRGYIPAPDTIFQNVHKLPPGHTLTLDSSGALLIEPYWDAADFYTDAPQSISEPDAQEELRGILTGAVQRRMISDVPLGAFLSGGIDSSLVVALMQSISTQPVKTFTIAFDDAQLDESKHALAVAQHLGTEHRVLRVDESNLLDFATDLAAYFDEPFADTSAIPTYALSALTREYVTVALSGDGGDETFLGYPTYQWANGYDRVHRHAPDALVTLGANALQLFPQRRIKRMARYLGHSDAVEAHRWALAHWTTPEMERLLGSGYTNGHVVSAENRMITALRERNLVQALAAADLTCYMVDDVLTKVDRASMAVALEVRVPLLDHLHVEFAARLPIELKMRNGKGKYLLRKLLDDYVPRELVDRPKQGFRVPMASWLRGPLRTSLQDFTHPSRLRQIGLFDEQFVTQLVSEHLSSKRDNSKQLWNLLVFLQWHDRYLS